MSTYLIGIDAGTSVIKSTLFDLAGHELARAAVDAPVDYPHPGWAELDMQVVWQGVVASVQKLLAAAPYVDAQAIAALGVTGQGDGTWLVDANHAPVRPAILWLDGRTADLIRTWQQDGTGEEFFRITGTVLNTSNQAAHLHWLQIHEPATLRRARYALRAKDWIFLRLTGVISTDESDASYTYFDHRQRRYSESVWPLLGIAAWRHLCPPAQPAYQNVAALLPDVAALLGLAPGTPIVAGPLDAVAVAVGVGALEPGDACTSLGTAGIHQFVLDQPNSAPANVGYTMCHAPPGRWVRLLPTMTCTLNLQWFVDEFFQAEVAAARQRGVEIWPELEALAAKVPIGSNGVMYHPYLDLAGERAPFVRPEARAQFSGLAIGHRRAELLRAVYEGVMLSGLDCYTTLPMQVRTLRLGGGGARSALWAQMFADALGAPVQLVEGQEFGAKGAALNAGVAVGCYASFADAASRTIRLARTYQPDQAKKALYHELLQLYRATYQAMFPVWAAREALQRRLYQIGKE